MYLVDEHSSGSEKYLIASILDLGVGQQVNQPVRSRVKDTQEGVNGVEANVSKISSNGESCRPAVNEQREGVEENEGEEVEEGDGRELDGVSRLSPKMAR